VTDVADERPCPSCGTPVSTTTPSEEGEQLALAEVDCPGCGVRLVRAVEGHFDHGWRVAERS
jgi:endogenous inhibitor of DNA gyrase (YacG/DUF329 family)